MTQRLKAIVLQSIENTDNNLQTTSVFEDSVSQWLKQENTSQLMKHENIKTIHECLQKLMEDKISIDDAIMCTSLDRLQDGIELYKQCLSNVWRTAKMWLQYLPYISVLKLFT